MPLASFLTVSTDIELELLIFCGKLCFTHLYGGYNVWYQFGKVQNSGTFPNSGMVFPNLGTVPEFGNPRVTILLCFKNSTFLLDNQDSINSMAEFCINFVTTRLNRQIVTRLMR